MSKRVLIDAKWMINAMISSIERMPLPDNTSQDIYDCVDASIQELKFLAQELGEAADKAEDTPISDIFKHYWD